CLHLRRPPTSPLLPYTTLFRSRNCQAPHEVRRRHWPCPKLCSSASFPNLFLFDWHPPQYTREYFLEYILTYPFCSSPAPQQYRSAHGRGWQSLPYQPPDLKHNPDIA